MLFNSGRDVVEVLLKLQASTNIPDQKGCYPLHLAAWRGNAGICQVLLSHGPSLAKVNAQASCCFSCCRISIHKISPFCIHSRFVITLFCWMFFMPTSLFFPISDYLYLILLQYIFFHSGGYVVDQLLSSLGYLRISLSIWFGDNWGALSLLFIILSTNLSCAYLSRFVYVRLPCILLISPNTVIITLVIAKHCGMNLIFISQGGSRSLPRMWIQHDSCLVPWLKTFHLDWRLLQLNEIFNLIFNRKNVTFMVCCYNASMLIMLTLLWFTDSHSHLNVHTRSYLFTLTHLNLLVHSCYTCPIVHYYIFWLWLFCPERDLGTKRRVKSGGFGEEDSVSPGLSPKNFKLRMCNGAFWKLLEV